MHLLIDTSVVGVAISAFSSASKPRIVWSGMSLENSRSSMTLPTLFEACMKCCSTNISEVQSIGIAAGPGSFTGIKVGWSFAQGLQLAHGISCFPYSTPIEALKSLNREYKIDMLFVPATKTNGFFLAMNTHQSIEITEIAVDGSQINFIPKEIGKLSDYYDVTIGRRQASFPGPKVAIGGKWESLINFFAKSGIEFMEVSEQELIFCAAKEVFKFRINHSGFVDTDSFEPFYLKKSAPEERQEKIMEKNG